MTTSRERVLCSLNHHQPDRVPVDLSGYRSSGIAAIAYPKLRAALALEPRMVDVYDPVQQLAIVHDDVLDRLCVDTAELGRGFCREDNWWLTGPCLTARHAGCRRGRNQSGPEQGGGASAERASDGANARASDNLRSGLLAVPRRRGGLSRIEELYPGHCGPVWRRRLGRRYPGRLNWPPERTRCAPARTGRSSDCSGAICSKWGNSDYRMNNFLMMLGGEPQRVHRFLDALMEVHLRNLEQFLGAVGDSLTSFASATISVRRTLRRSLHGCTANSSSRATPSYGGAPSNSPT